MMLLLETKVKNSITADDTTTHITLTGTNIEVDDIEFELPICIDLKPDDIMRFFHYNKDVDELNKNKLIKHTDYQSGKIYHDDELLLRFNGKIYEDFYRYNKLR